jgi:hypothetical protein
MKLHPLALAVCGALFAPAVAFGQATVSDSFAGDPGAIAGRGGGTGFGDNWTGAGNVVAPGLTFPALVTAGNRFDTAGGNNGAFRTLAAPIGTDAGTVFVGFLTSATGATPPDYAGLSFFSGGQSNEELFLGMPFQTGNYGFDVPGVGVQTAATAPVSPTPSLLVYRLTFTPSAERIDFYANPTPGVLPLTHTLAFNIPQGTFADTLTAIRLQSGDGPGGANPFSFDELRVGTSFDDVAPAVPEPATLGLLGAASLLLLRRRRA